MTDEPIYIDGDNPWEAEDTAWMYLSDFPEEHVSLVRLAMDATGRTSHTFRRPSEHRAWKTIIGQVQRGLIPVQWIEQCIAYARKKNKGSGHGVRYTFDTLTKYVRNKGAMTDWQSKHPEVFRKPGGYDVPD